MDASDYVRGASKAKGATDDITTAAGKTESAARTLAKQYGGLAKAVATAFVARTAVDFAKDSIRAFSDLEESVNAVEVMFGRGADAIKDFGKTAAVEVGLSNAQFNTLASKTGAVLTGFIDDEKEAAKQTIKLMRRASDLASVFNTTVPEAAAAVGSALRGEMEPIRNFGVVLDDASIRAYAVASGMAETTAQVTPQVKGLATLELIYQRTDKVAGDFLNTSEGLANKQRTLAAKFEDTKAAIGESLAPAMHAL